MNPDLQSKLEASATELLAWAEQAGTTASGFIEREVPLVVREMIVWAQVCGAIVLGIALIFAVFSIAMLWFGARRLKTTHDVGEIGSRLVVVSLVILGIGVLLSPIWTIPVVAAIKATVAPRLFILDQIRGLL